MSIVPGCCKSTPRRRVGIGVHCGGKTFFEWPIGATGRASLRATGGSGVLASAASENRVAAFAGQGEYTARIYQTSAFVGTLDMRCLHDTRFRAACRS